MKVADGTSLEVAELRRRILDSARDEVLARGILGMRVANVAKRAGCSITAMYRQFGSRDGILAEVLIVLYEERFDWQFAVARERLGGNGPLTIDDLVASLPMPHWKESRQTHALRSQILAVAAVNPILRARLSEHLRTRRRMLHTVLDDVERRSAPGTRLNREVIRVLVFNLHWHFNDLVGDEAVSNSEYAALIRRLIQC